MLGRVALPAQTLKIPLVVRSALRLRDDVVSGQRIVLRSSGAATNARAVGLDDTRRDALPSCTVASLSCVASSTLSDRRAAAAARAGWNEDVASEAMAGKRQINPRSTIVD